jgi:hypothetical protein
MRILGVQWMASRLYPDLYKKDLPEETRAFFHLFLKADISRDEAQRIISSGM